MWGFFALRRECFGVFGGCAFVARALPFGVLVFAMAFVRRWVCCADGLVFRRLRWHPRYAFVLQALPLCGAAPTFLCRRKEK
jgi:hypothetical protein